MSAGAKECRELTIGSMSGDYRVFFCDRGEIFRRLAEQEGTAFLIDRRVARLYREDMSAILNFGRFMLFDAVEENKNLDTAAEVYQWLVSAFTEKRNLKLVAVGGGITQDVAGFVASTLYRGISWSLVPTTLLAQCDSCIGGKSSLNFRQCKNLLGTFYPPGDGIFIDPGFTRTLAHIDFESGCGEIIKFLLMRGFDESRLHAVAGRAARLLNGEGVGEAVYDTLKAKRDFIQNDEFDRGDRRLLNYGHTFGHALEAVSGYYVPHGVAVNVGLVFANLAAARRGMFSGEKARWIAEHINLPLLGERQRREDYDPEELLAHLANDKKRIGPGYSLVVPDGDALVLRTDFTADEIKVAINDLIQLIFSK